MKQKLKNVNQLAFAAIIVAGALSACNKDDDQPELPQPVINEPENITTVELHLHNESTDEHSVYSWSDTDGPGGEEPVVDDIVLDLGVTYSGEVFFLDKSGDAVLDLTAEIREEDDEHIVCYELHETELENAITIMATDSDGSYDVGMETEWTVVEVANGEVHIVLKHQPDGLKDGTCEPGDTDVDVSFNISINN